MNLLNCFPVLLRPRREARQARLRPPDVTDAGGGEGARRLPAEIRPAQLAGGPVDVLPAGNSWSHLVTC